MKFIYDKTKTLNQMLKDCVDFNFKQIDMILFGSDCIRVDFS